MSEPFRVEVGKSYEAVNGTIVGPMYLKEGWHDSMRHAVLEGVELTWHQSGESYARFPVMNLVREAPPPHL